MERYYQKEIECASQEQIKAWQDERLVRQVRHVWDKVPYYRSKMEEKGVTPEDIHGRDDLYKLPFLSKADLRDAYPFGLLAEPLEKCVRIHSTSGTTGKRVVAFYTKEDIDLWNDCCARALAAAGAGPEDVCQVAYGYGLFTGGFGLNGGSQKLGCLTLPMSSGNTDRQLQFMEDLGSTILCCTPSYAAYLGECVTERGLRGKIHLKAGIFGAEAWSEEMRRDIENKLGLKAYDIYGLTELSGPGVAFECSEQAGMHINEDHFIAEIIDPETCEPLPYGTQGELVFTSLTKKGFPMLRYRTRDITRIIPGQCACGRTHRRIDRLHGRTDDMLIIRGVNVFPSQIEDVMKTFPEMSSWYQIEVDTDHRSLDIVTLKAEPNPNVDLDSIADIDRLQKRISAALKAALSVGVKVKLVEPKSIPRSEGKAKRIVDLRKEL